jgi:hypothetical protein
MSKVFVVTGGERDYEHVVGVFSTRKLAEATIKASEESLQEIEEYDLDELVEFEIGPVYETCIRVHDGKIAWQDKYEERKFRHPTECEFEERGGPKWGSDLHIVARSPISAEHSEKAAIEYRQEYLRETPGVASGQQAEGTEK